MRQNWFLGIAALSSFFAYCLISYKNQQKISADIAIVAKTSIAFHSFAASFDIELYTQVFIQIMGNGICLQ